MGVKPQWCMKNCCPIDTIVSPGKSLKALKIFYEGLPEENMEGPFRILRVQGNLLWEFFLHTTLRFDPHFDRQNFKHKSVFKGKTQTQLTSLDIVHNHNLKLSSTNTILSVFV